MFVDLPWGPECNKAGIVLTGVEVRNMFNLEANGFVAQSRDRAQLSLKLLIPQIFSARGLISLNIVPNIIVSLSLTLLDSYELQGAFCLPNRIHP